MFLFKRQICFDLFGDWKTSEHSFFPLFVQSFVMMLVFRIFLGRNWQISFFSELSVWFEHSSFSIGHYGIAEARNINGVPSTAKNDVTFQYFVFESGSKGSSWSSLFHSLLYLAPNSWNSLELGSLEFGNFKCTCEHTFHKSYVFLYIIWFSDKFQLFHDLKLRVEFENNSSDRNSEIWNISSFQILHTHKGCSHSESWCVYYSIAEAKFGRIFNHSHFVVTLDRVVLHGKNRHRLELSPANRKHYGVLIFKHMRIPTMLFDFHSHKRKT